MPASKQRRSDAQYAVHASCWGERRPRPPAVIGSRERVTSALVIGRNWAKNDRIASSIGSHADGCASPP